MQTLLTLTDRVSSSANGVVAQNQPADREDLLSEELRNLRAELNIAPLANHEFDCGRNSVQ